MSKWNLENLTFSVGHPIVDYCHIDQKQLVESMQVERYGLIMLSREDQWNFLINNRNSLLDMGVLEKFVIDLYTMFNTPFRTCGLMGWEYLFEVCDKEKLNTIEDNGSFSPLGERLAVYRGASTTEPEGLSWTLSKEVAEMFAKRNKDFYGEETAVYSVWISREDILFCTNCREEMEVVLEPEFLDAGPLLEPISY